MSEGSARLSVVQGGRSGTGTIAVVGVSGATLDGLDDAARRAVAGAMTVAGSRRHLDSWRAWVPTPSGRDARARTVPTIEMNGDADLFAQQIALRAVDDGHDVCVLVSGDPGFFGVVGALLRVVDRSILRVLPAPSSVAVAFARLGLPWDDAVVVPAQGPLHPEVVHAIRPARKAAVLSSPDSPPQAIGRALVDAGVSMDLVAVCSRLGYPDEQVTETTLDGLARGAWDPLSVVVLVGPGGLQAVGWGAGRTDLARSRAWGLPADRFRRPEGIVTPAEARAVALGKLALPQVGVLWDVGSGAGSVAVECARLAPGLTVFALDEPGAEAAAAANASGLAAVVHVVDGPVAAAFDRLPDPDRVHIGEGHVEHLDTVLRRLRGEGRVVVTSTSLDDATAAATKLGALVQISVQRARMLGSSATPTPGDGPGSSPDDGGLAGSAPGSAPGSGPAGRAGWRLVAEDAVFVAWGPDPDPAAPHEPAQR